MPVVIGQPIAALLRLAPPPPLSFIVIPFPLRTLAIIASTSVGAAPTHVPSPHWRLMGPPICTTLGKPLSSASFSRQVLRTATRASRLKLADCNKVAIAFPNDSTPYALP